MTAVVSAMIMAGCGDIIPPNTFTLAGPQGQQIIGTVYTRVPIQGLITIDLNTTTAGCAFSPSTVFAKKPEPNDTTSFTTTVYCKNGHGTIQGQVDRLGVVSMTVTDWTNQTK